VSIARALLTAPELVLADEPTGNLDTKTGLEIMGILDDIHRRGNTVIVVTHEEEVAARSHRVIRLRDGRIESDRSTRPAQPAPA
jgi:putative ABC transport system ATP-binding protein